MQIERNSTAKRRYRVSRSLAVLTLVFAGATAIGASAATLDRIRETGHIRFGYLAKAPPFTSETESGPQGYSVDLCNRVAAEVKKELGMAKLDVKWVPVNLDNRLRGVQEGAIDLVCSPTGVTWERRKEVSFSAPVFSGGARAVLRSDASSSLRNALADVKNFHVVWRSSPAAKMLSGTTVAVVAGTTTESWLARRLVTLELDAQKVTVPNYEAGLQMLRDHKADIFFADRVFVLNTIGAQNYQANKEFIILERLLTYEPFALALARGDEDFRLVVDRALGDLYASKEFRDLHTKWLGEFNDNARNFFLWNTVEQ